MRITRDKHWQFLEDELKAQTEEFKAKFEARAMRLLEETGEMYVAIFESFHNNGSMVMKFPNTRPIPRKGAHLLCMLLPKELRSPSAWGDKTYKDLYSERYKGTECVCIYQGKCNDSRFTIVGFRGVDVEFQREIDNHPGLILVFAPQFPPLEYAANLQRVVRDASSPGVASIVDAEYRWRSWEPRLINEDDAAKVVLSQMELAPTTILQGPPGTGKTFAIAKICAEMCDSGKSVLVTALTNRALIELALKPALKRLLAAGKVSKINLTTDEAKEVRGLRCAQSYDPTRGELLLSTFYKSSGIAASAAEDGLFDCVIMDEASQAFTAMFAAVAKLGKNNLWVGDIRQLAPVVELNPDRVRDSGYDDLIDGLRLISCNREYPVMQLTKTYRLGARATAFTGIFYDDTLVSAVKDSTEILSSLKTIANRGGGPSLLLVPMSIGDPTPQSAIQIAVSMVKGIVEESPKKQIAVLAHQIKTVVALQKAIAREIDGKGDVLVETVARVQGLTTDITIFIVPNTATSYSHGLDCRLFNVATSRAREHTIIIADRSVLECTRLDLDVIYYLRKLSGEMNEIKKPETVELCKDDVAEILPRDEEGDAIRAEIVSTNEKITTVDAPHQAIDVYHINKVLDGIQVFLVKWMQEMLPKVFPVDCWSRGVINVLTPDQREEALESKAKSLADLDFAALISVLLGNFKLFRAKVRISQEVPDLARHIKKIRNVYAHKNVNSIVNASVDKINFHMAVLRHFLTELNTSEDEVLRMLSTRTKSEGHRAETVIRKNGFTIKVK